MTERDMPSPITRVQSKDLKKFLDSSKKPTRIIGDIERHMMTRKVQDDRRQDVLHPSEIIKSDWCMREAYYRILDARQGIAPPKEQPSLRLQSIFDVGHAVHAKWQGYLTEMGVLWGSWKCLECGAVTTPSPLPDHCPVCLGIVFLYRELHLFDKDLLISGSTDGWIMGPEDMLLEIKSIGTGTIRTYDSALLQNSDNNLEKAFGNIRRPFVDHRRQGQTYLRLAHHMYDHGLLERTPPEEIVFLYECKSNQAYKEFTVHYDPESVDDVFEAAADLAWAIDRRKPPTCSVNRYACHACSPYKDRP